MFKKITILMFSFMILGQFNNKSYAAAAGDDPYGYGDADLNRGLDELYYGKNAANLLNVWIDRGFQVSNSLNVYLHSNPALVPNELDRLEAIVNEIQKHANNANFELQDSTNFNQMIFNLLNVAGLGMNINQLLDRGRLSDNARNLGSPALNERLKKIIDKLAALKINARNATPRAR